MNVAVWHLENQAFRMTLGNTQQLAWSNYIYIYIHTHLGSFILVCTYMQIANIKIRMYVENLNRRRKRVKKCKHSGADRGGNYIKIHST